MYNRIDNQKRMVDRDATKALMYLHNLLIVDPLLYWQYEVHSEGLLCHLFQVDGKAKLTMNLQRYFAF